MTNKQISSSSVKNTKIYGSNAIYMLENTKPSKLARFKRFLIGTVIILFLVSLIAFGVLRAIGGQSTIEQDVQWVQVEVEAGQSLWSLVSENQPVDSEVDTRELVYIAEKHHHGSNVLHAGETISIPVYKK
jgi:hypothetical protein